QRVELEFAQVLERQGDLQRLTYPLRTGRTTATTLQDFTLTVNVSTDQPIRTVYSPTHEVDVNRQSDTTAVIGLEQSNADLERDFVLYLSTSDDEVGLNLMSFDPDGDGGEDGYFLMVLSPRLEREEEVRAKDVTFVVDTSGSMAGDKIEQARNTLLYCISQLRPEDTFNIVRFSTTTRSLFPNLSEANPDNIQRAETFIAEMRAAGGTAIEEALSVALRQESASDRPHMVIFITDGLPTVGETASDRLLTMVRGQNNEGTRFFTFGVGYDVDTQLLDLLARDTRGVSDYVRPEENIEMAVSTLYDRIRSPVLTDVSLTIAGVEAYDTFPRELPDLFAGQQVVVAGRFRGPGSADVHLNGRIQAESAAYDYSEDFVTNGEASKEHDYIPQLWATRKIGFLINEIRLNGETTELRDEVRNLGVQYGLVTPYTSYLAVDDSEFQPRPDVAIPIREEPMGMRGGWGANSEGAFSGRSASGSADPAAPAMQFDLDEVSGEEAVESARETRRLAEVERSEGSAVRFVGGRRFEYSAGAWRSREGADGAARRVSIQFNSDAYYELLSLRPEVVQWVSLGSRVEFPLDDLIIEIDASGVTELDDELRGLIED
ncbi:MAG: VWA domain-containing protein, partial [Myxococcales bacterium]|nr:VWA domain-containing protein [Myxococcales bacterium]